MACPPGVQKRFGVIMIHSGSLAVKIKFPNHEVGDPSYIDKVRAPQGALHQSRGQVPGVATEL